MKLNRGLAGIVLTSFWLTLGHPLSVRALQQEYVTTTPVLLDGVLYVASTDPLSHRGHLRAIEFLDSLPRVLWDAADRMPLAGTGARPGELPDSDPPASVRYDNQYRSIFTNLGSEQLPFVGSEAFRLQPALGMATIDETELLLHAVRGRRGGSPELVAGLGEDPQRLWGLSRSAPVLVGEGVSIDGDKQRDRVLYVGAEDGMLHAFLTSRWNAGAENYLIDDAAGGAELWAFLPGSFLPHLQSQPLVQGLEELAVHLDGTPVVSELFIDLDGDGSRRWHTLLAASGTLLQLRQSCLFVIDITDPYRPQLIWETLLPGVGSGRTRGVVIDRCVGNGRPQGCLYMTADFVAGDGLPGIHALALGLTTGELLWQFSAPYAAAGPVAEATPAVPAMMDIDGDHRKDILVFGDLVGRLWALDLEHGQPYGEAPAYQVPGGPAEPIGAEVAVHGQMAIFGTGGVAGTDDHRQYALYALEISPRGNQLRWVYSLAVGEKVWAKPVVDAAGMLVFGTATGYSGQVEVAELNTSGRLVALDESGLEHLSQDMSAALIGTPVSAPGVTVMVTLTGGVTQLGRASRMDGSIRPPGSVRILSWRER